MLIPKSVLDSKVHGVFRGIGIIKVLWKTVTGIMNFLLALDIAFLNILNGFRDVKVIGTSSLEAKLLQKLTAMR